MNIKQMQSALEKVNVSGDTTPRSKQPRQPKQPSQPLLATVGSVVGAFVPTVRKNTDTFFSAMKTSYQYHDAVRRGDI